AMARTASFSASARLPIWTTTWAGKANDRACSAKVLLGKTITAVKSDRAARIFSHASMMTGKWRVSSLARLPGNSTNLEADSDSSLDEDGELASAHGGLPFAFEYRSMMGLPTNFTGNCGTRLAYQSCSNGKILSSKSKSLAI